MKITQLIAIFLSVCFSGLVAKASPITSGEPLVITIKGVPVEEQGRVSGTYVVADNGTVRLPMLSSSINARGISPADLGRKIENAYKIAGIYTTPSIAVLSQKAINEEEENNERLITVAGQVVRAGHVQFREGMNLFQAIQAAGGETAFGSLRRVKILRKGAQKVYDLREAKNKLVLVYPTDMIEIPQKNWLGQ